MVGKEYLSLSTIKTGRNNPEPGKTAFQLGRWLTISLVVFIVLITSGWLLSEWFKESIDLGDPRSKLEADYSPWEEVEFKPVDPKIVEGLLPDTGVDGAYDALPDPDTAGWFWYDTDEREIIATIFPEQYPLATPNESPSGPFLTDSDEDVPPTETVPLDP